MPWWKIRDTETGRLLRWGAVERPEDLGPLRPGEKAYEGRPKPEESDRTDTLRAAIQRLADARARRGRLGANEPEGLPATARDVWLAMLAEARRAEKAAREEVERWTEG